MFPALQRVRGGGAQHAAQAQQGGGQEAPRAPSGCSSQELSRPPSSQEGQEEGQEGQPRGGLRVCQDHDEEGAKLEELGRLLGAVKAHAR